MVLACPPRDHHPFDAGFIFDGLKPCVASDYVRLPVAHVKLDPDRAPSLATHQERGIAVASWSNRSWNSVPLCPATNAIRGSKSRTSGCKPFQTLQRCTEGWKRSHRPFPTKLHSRKGSKRSPSFQAILSLTPCRFAFSFATVNAFPERVQGKNPHAAQDSRQRDRHTTGACSHINQHGPFHKPALSENLLDKEFGLRPRNQHRRIHMKVEATKFLCPQDVL